MKTNIAQVNTAPFEPPSAVRDPNPATHPDKVDITASLHMASLVDEYWSHGKCRPPPESPPASHAPPLQPSPGYVSTHLRSWWIFGLQDAQTLPALSAVVPAGHPCRCCSSAMFRSVHLPAPALDGLQGPPNSPAPAIPHTDSTCPWCHSEVTLPSMPSFARDLGRSGSG
jgi:hypothetical protein